MSSGGGAHDGAQPSGGVPGKRTLTQGLEPIFRKADLGGGSASADSPAVTTALGGGGGEPLPTGLRASVEGATGGDLSAARVHREPEAVAAASALRARAFTYGNDIFLGAGEDVGDTRLMAHEATHVLQQDRGALQRKGREVVAESDPAEVEADRVADAVATGGHHALPVMSLGAGGIVRTPVNHVTTSAEIPPVVVSERAPTIARSPKGGTQDIHDQLIEDFRRENGFPPHGTDPLTGAQDGPTNSEIRFGGLLDRWLANRQSGHASSSPQAPGQPQAQTPGTGVRGVAAPAVSIKATPGTFCPRRSPTSVASRPPTARRSPHCITPLYLRHKLPLRPYPAPAARWWTRTAGRSP